MLKLTISTNFPQVERKLLGLREDVAGRALASAVNKTLAQGETAMGREITAQFNIKRDKVKKALRVNRASYRAGVFRIQGSLESPSKRGRSLNLINFVEGFVTLAEARRRSKAGTLDQLRFRIKKTGKPAVIKGAFVGNAGRTIFTREGKGRLPIKALQTIDVAQMFNTKRINERVVQFILTKFPEILEHEIEFYTNRFGGIA